MCVIIAVCIGTLGWCAVKRLSRWAFIRPGGASISEGDLTVRASAPTARTEMGEVLLRAGDVALAGRTGGDRCSARQAALARPAWKLPMATTTCPAAPRPRHNPKARVVHAGSPEWRGRPVGCIGPRGQCAGGLGLTWRKAGAIGERRGADQTMHRIDHRQEDRGHHCRDRRHCLPDQHPAALNAAVETARAGEQGAALHRWWPAKASLAGRSAEQRARSRR